MRRSIFFIAILFGLPLAADWAPCWCASPTNWCDDYASRCCRDFRRALLPPGCGWEFEIRAAAVRMSSDRFQAVVCRWQPQYELQLSKAITTHIYVWTNVGGMWDKGRSQGLRDHTHFFIIPVSVGVSYLWRFSLNTSGYLGAGLSYAVFHSRDHSPGVHKHVQSNSFGYVLKSGLHFRIFTRNFLDVFMDYSIQRFEGKKLRGVRVRQDLGGLRLGAGLGTYF